MAGPRSPYSKAKTAHNKLTKQTPVEKATLLTSLAKLTVTGASLLSEQKVTLKVYASDMSGFIGSALGLEAQPPYDPTEVSELQAKLTIYEGILEGATATAPTEPTSTQALKTTGAKG